MKIEIKNNPISNEVCKSKIHWNVSNIKKLFNFFIIRNYIVLLIEIHFTFKIWNFHMDFLTNHMSTNIYRLIYQYFNHKHVGEYTLNNIVY